MQITLTCFTFGVVGRNVLFRLEKLSSTLSLLRRNRNVYLRVPCITGAQLYSGQLARTDSSGSCGALGGLFIREEEL